MKYEAILFDLDGTLLPMDNDEFTKGYLSMLSEAVKHLGYEKETFIPAMWKGVSAMVKNDGSRSNSDAFWSMFSTFFGDKVYDHIPVFDEFYKGEFNKAIKFSVPTELSKEVVNMAHQKAEKVILATNPFFPRVAIDSRLGWINLKDSDFDYITDYENSSKCKPNPGYYLEITEKLGLNPKNCLMIGNNASEDAEAAAKVGMDTYLVTDYLICEGECPDCPKGSMAELPEFLKNL